MWEEKGHGLYQWINETFPEKYSQYVLTKNCFGSLEQIVINWQIDKIKNIMSKMHWLGFGFQLQEDLPGLCLYRHIISNTTNVD